MQAPLERIAKVIARSGLCSRRDAEKLVAEARVTVNGKTIDTPATKVTDADEVKVDGQSIAKKEETRMWLFHKPKGVITSHKDPKGRTTLFSLLPKELGHLKAVGRLDYNTEGLLLLTNNGELSRHLELPKTGWIRKYRVRVYGRVKEEQLKKLTKGVTIKGIRYKAEEASIESQKGSNCWVLISLKEGKNREIRVMMESLGLAVNRLIRTSYGIFSLGDLSPESYKEIPRKQMRASLPASLL